MGECNKCRELREKYIALRKEQKACSYSPEICRDIEREIDLLIKGGGVDG